MQRAGSVAAAFIFSLLLGASPFTRVLLGAFGFTFLVSFGNGSRADWPLPWRPLRRGAWGHGDRHLRPDVSHPGCGPHGEGPPGCVAGGQFSPLTPPVDRTPSEEAEPRGPRQDSAGRHLGARQPLSPTEPLAGG